MSDGDDSAALWKVNRTIHELVKDRGYQVADEEINMSLADFKAQYANNGGTVDRNQLNFFHQLPYGSLKSNIHILLRREECWGKDYAKAPQHPRGEEHREGHHHFSGYDDLFRKKSYFCDAGTV